MDWVVWEGCTEGPAGDPEEICLSTPVTVLNHACEDGFDNDGDEDIDYPADSSCSSADDSAEITDP
jgi:hypothetical protein